MKAINEGGDKMALSTNKLTSALILKVKTGTTKSGSDKFSNITFKKVKIAAVDQDVYDVANSIGGILSHPVIDVLRQDESELISA